MLSKHVGVGLGLLCFLLSLYAGYLGYGAILSIAYNGSSFLEFFGLGFLFLLAALWGGVCSWLIHKQHRKRGQASGKGEDGA